MIYVRWDVVDFVYDLKSDKEFVHCQSAQKFCSSLMRSDPVSEVSRNSIIQIRDIKASFENNHLMILLWFDNMTIINPNSYRISLIFDDCNVDLNWQLFYDLIDKHFNDREIMRLICDARKVSVLNDVINHLCLMSV